MEGVEITDNVTIFLRISVRQIEIDQETNSHSYLLLGNFPCAGMKNIYTPSGASIIWSKTKNHQGIDTYRFKKYN